MALAVSAPKLGYPGVRTSPKTKMGAFLKLLPIGLTTWPQPFTIAFAGEIHEVQSRPYGTVRQSVTIQLWTLAEKTSRNTGISKMAAYSAGRADAPAKGVRVKSPS